MDSNFQQEQKRVTDVMEVIEKRISRLEEETTQRRNEVVQITSKVTTLRSLGYNSIAIICKSAEESKHAFEALSDIKDIKLLTNSSIEYEQGVVVIPSYLSKGIEFDAVIIYDASEQVYGDESLRRLFYTACTRAMHYLQLYSLGIPTPLLKNVLRDSFTES